MNSLRSQDFDKALRLCAAGLQKAPGDKRMWALRGMAYAGRGDSSSALRAYQHAIQLDPAYLPALEGAAQIEYRQRSPDAKELIKRVLAQVPGDATSNTMLGYLAYTENDCAAAVRYFQQGGEMLAGQPSALAAFGSCQARLEHYDLAVPLFQQALEADPSNRSIRFDTALAQWKANQPDEALATLQPAIEAGGEDALLLAADIYEAKNDTQHSIDLLRKAILNNPKNLDAYLDFASLSYDHDSAQVGIDILSTGLTQLPNEAQLYLVRGILFAQLGKFDEATNDFEKAGHLDPRLSFLAAAEGLEASQQHKASAALSSFRAAAKAHPQDALSQYLLAEALSQQSPAEGSADYTEEIAAAKRASRLDRSLVVAHDLLATIYLQDGHTELAIEESRAALQADPKDQQALYHLILALRKTGQKEQIAELLKQLNTLRNAAQAEHEQVKRYRLQEIPLSAPLH